MFDVARNPLKPQGTDAKNDYRRSEMPDELGIGKRENMCLVFDIEKSQMASQISGNIEHIKYVQI